MIPNESHIAWVANKVGRELTRPERELVTIVCAALQMGPWDVSNRWVQAPGDASSASILVPYLSTYDNAFLTRLVFAAHDRCCRVEVEGASSGRLRIVVTPREIREGGEYWQRHPTIEQALADWRKEHPEEGLEEG